MYLRQASSYFITCLFLLSTTVLADVAKVLVDTDLAHYSDDHETLVMLANLHKRKRIELIGVTLVTGNDWLEQIEVDALRVMERIQLQNEIPVYSGAERPLLHSEQQFKQFDKRLYGAIYAGAWQRKREINSPPDGMPTSAKLQPGHAANFIIDTVRANPGEVTILALGPLTNLALALRMAPDIADDIKSIVYMGGAFFVWGNVTTAAEFNWWFDAEAAAIVLAEPIQHVIVPLDATDRILFTKKHYQEWVIKKYPSHFMSNILLQPKFIEKFNHNPDYMLPVWDALVAAYIAEPGIVSKQEDYWVSINTQHGPDYGRSNAAPINSEVSFIVPHHPSGTQKANVILEMNESRFWEIYEDLVFDAPDR